MPNGSQRGAGFISLCLQRPFEPTERCHPIEVAVADLAFQRGNNLVLSGQEIGTGEIHTGNRVVGDERAVAGQVLHKQLQLLQHFLQFFYNATILPN